MRLYPEVPHPFAIYFPADAESFEPDEKFTFEFILFGRGAQYLPHVICAFQILGKMGLGKIISGRRGKFQVETVQSLLPDKTTIFQHPSSELTFVEPASIDVEGALKEKASVSIEVAFMSPLRLKYKEKIVKSLEFHMLTRSLLRRVSSLLYFHNGRELELDFNALVSRSEQIRKIKDGSSWKSYHRFSSRQKRKMEMGGLVGSIRFEGDVSEFRPLLALGEIIQLGKNTSFGLGKYCLVG